MIDHTCRITLLVRDALKKAALGEPVGYAVTQTFAPVPMEGQISMHPCWLVTVTIRNTLIGQPPIGLAVPVAGVMPDDGMFAAVAVQLLERCRQERDNLNEMPRGVPDEAH